MTAALKNEVDEYTRTMADSNYLFPSGKGDQPIGRGQAWQI